jgi:hypothetical protein
MVAAVGMMALSGGAVIGSAIYFYFKRLPFLQNPYFATPPNHLHPDLFSL